MYYIINVVLQCNQERYLCIWMMNLLYCYYCTIIQMSILLALSCKKHDMM